MKKTKKIDMYDDYRYVDFGRHWGNKIGPIFESKLVQKQLFEDFTKFVKDKQRNVNKSVSASRRVNWCYGKNDTPSNWDSSEWRSLRKGRAPAYDKYVCHMACHYIVNSLWLTASIVYPNKPWIIVSSDKHSTVWDQEKTFFDLNYFALKVPPSECAKATILNRKSHFLDEGELL